MEEKHDWYKTCTTCGGPADGYVVNEEDKLSWCETCYDRDELPKLQAQYPDTMGTPILIAAVALGVYALATVLQAVAYVATWFMSR